MDIWAWIGEFAERAYEARDRERWRLVEIMEEALPEMTPNPAAALTALSEGRALAERLAERRWVLFFDHWRLQTLIFHTRDYAAALPLALAAVRESAQDEYKDLPQRICLREDLIWLYQGIDPAGRAADVQDALAYMKAEAAPGCQCQNCIQEVCTAQALALGQTDAAEQAAARALRLAVPASDYHHAVAAYADLCEVAYRRGDWDRLRQWASGGARFAGSGVPERSVATLELWEAAALQQAGERATAYARYRSARRRIRPLGGVPTEAYFDAWAAYFAAAGRPRAALLVRGRERDALRGKGQTYRECICLLAQCRLRAQLGLGWDSEADALAAAAQGLADPAAFLGPLAALRNAPPKTSD